jgi:hypothetical protein
MPEPAMSSDLSELIERGFEGEFHSHARAILTVDFPQALAELEEVLLGLKSPAVDRAAVIGRHFWRRPKNRRRADRGGGSGIARGGNLAVGVREWSAGSGCG